jgi:hypothetical protein
VLLEDFGAQSASRRLAQAFAEHERRRIALEDDAAVVPVTEEAASRTLVASRTLLSDLSVR